MRKTTKTIGTVVAMPAGGFVAVATRYPNGRKLPEARLFADGVFPFRDKGAALKVLEAFKSEPLGVRHITLDALQPLPEEIVVHHVPNPAPMRSSRSAGRSTRSTQAPAPLPPMEKRAVSASRERTPSYAGSVVTATARTIKVTKCPEMVCRRIPAGKMMGA